MAPENFREFVKELGFRFLMAGLGVAGYIILFLIGDRFGVGFLQSQIGILVTLLVIVLLGVVVYASDRL